MAPVSLKNVSKIYHDHVKAVDNINLNIENEEFLVLVGPSGCGKSTTLRMIAGLEEMTSGTISIGDRIVNDVPAKDRNIAMVFQNYAPYPHMTVFENMAFGLKLRRYPHPEIVRRVHEAAEVLGIKKLLDRRPRELSGGERQRVAVGRAIVRKPLVFLFDEPLSNLDAKLRVQMRTEIHKLRLRLQTTFIYVTHDQTEAMTMGDRIAVMNEGKIQQCADPITVYDHPANQFVAGFIGSPPINFLQGKIVKNDGKLFFDEGSFQIRIVEDMFLPLSRYVGQDVTLGIRPEDVYDKLFMTEAPRWNTIRATCEVVEPMGSEVYLNLNTGRHTLTARVAAHNKPEINRDMEFVLDMSKVHFFDRETEQTII